MKNTMNNDFCPEANDFLYKFVAFIFRSKPAPAMVAFLYFVLASGGTVFLGFISGLLFGRNTNLSPIYKDYMNIINVGIIAPIGARLLINLYDKMKNTFVALRENNIIKDKLDEYQELLADLSKLYSSKIIIFIALAIAIIFNIIVMIKKKDSWSGIHGGITAFYFRFFVIINYYMIVIILYKCIVTTLALNRVFKFDLNLQPLHPDKCGGIKSIGSLAIAMHYFLQLILVFLTMIAFFNPKNLHNILFVLMFIALVIITMSSLFFSLYKAHDKMQKTKIDLLSKLHLEFQKYYESLYRNLSAKTFEKETADNLQSINNLYTLANNMPVWPFDFQSLLRFFSTISIPILFFLLQMLVNADSIIYNLDRLNILKYIFK